MAAKKRKIKEEADDTVTAPKEIALNVSNDILPNDTMPKEIAGVARSISACQRCRNKKIKCDQRFPKCSKCEKSGVDCVGFDPLTGREIPRSYVVHLEKRIKELEQDLLIARQQSEVVPEAPKLLQSPHEHPKEFAFSRLMTTAVKVNQRDESRDAPGPRDALRDSSNTSDEPSPAILPPKMTALYFMQIYFAQSNSQIPILHREEFIAKYFVPVYGVFDYEDVTLASNLTSVNTQFIAENSPQHNEVPWFDQYREQLQRELQKGSYGGDLSKISESIVPPARYHRSLYFLNMVFAIASSVHHLQYPITISHSFRMVALRYLEDRLWLLDDPLEALQGVLLHATYATMRPTVPAVWYILGTALRMCVEWDLHNEKNTTGTRNLDFYTIDKRRRLFWCAYSIDRQICFYLDRPVGIPDESIHTPFPSALDDAVITKEMSTAPLDNTAMPSYKNIAIAMFKMRKIQSEVQRVLYTAYEVPRAYASVDTWKRTMSARLNNWLEQIPTTPETMNCDFNLMFFHINYHHTNLMLHNLAPKNWRLSAHDFAQVHLSSRELIRCYTVLLARKLINYTWAAVHNTFSAGTSYLYAVYNSKEVFGTTSLAEVKQVTLACLRILQSLFDRFEAAVHYYEVYQSLTMAVVKLRYNETMNGYSHFKVTVETLRKVSDTNLHSNLSRLVHNLHNDGGAEGDSDLLNPLVASTSNPHGLMLKSNPRTDPADDPDTFLWLSPWTSKLDTPGETAEKYDLDTFFKELQNLSPTYTHSMGSRRDWNGDSPVSAPQMSHEGRKTFELMHQMPNEVIWDQFFSNSKRNSLEEV